MSWWDTKVSKLKEVIVEEGLKETRSKHAVCIHGDESCARCTAADISNTQNESSSWEALDKDDIKKVIYSLPEAVVKVMKRHPKKVVLAGGFIRAMVSGEQVNDIDLFVQSIDDAKSFLDDIGMNYKAKDKHLLTEPSMQTKYEVQTIWRYAYNEPYEIPDQFDYTVVKAAIWFDQGGGGRASDFIGICHDRFYRDIGRKMLVYSCDRDVERVQSIPRLIKYISYGYSIAPKDLAEVVVKTCLSLNLEKGFEGMKKDLEECYLPTGKDRDWSKMTEEYVKPKPVERSYGYGS